MGQAQHLARTWHHRQHALQQEALMAAVADGTQARLLQMRAISCS